MTPTKDKSSHIEVPKGVLFGLVASLILLVVGGIVTVAFALPQRIADNATRGAVNATAIDGVRDALRRIEADVSEIRRDVKELRK